MSFELHADPLWMRQVLAARAPGMRVCDASKINCYLAKILATVNSFRSVAYDEQYSPAAMIISFKERHYLSLWRRELISTTDALAKLGGLIALLLGASAISLGELLYFCCVRPLRRERGPRGSQIVASWNGQNDN
ncbi:uncharacterized protein LOC128092889 [Culex pipiens pallens]|uniref:uncharacterized protein LOC128092889 n=1 Tax=Culex pipiens pallens TaxID=42434 RepID=UPI0019548B25|nr:uncharacterized protein LOC128092889 [Culex pipiens pallens]